MNEVQFAERVTLTLTREQALVAERACELLARLHIGQFNTVTEMLLDSRRDMDDYCRRRDMANTLLYQAALAVFGRNVFGQPDIERKSLEHERAWLIYTTLRHARSWHDHPEGGYTVNFDKPLPIGEYMPKCTITEGNEQ